MVETLRIIAVAQGLACMLGVIAAGIATGNHWACWLAIVSLGLAYVSTTVLILFEPPEAFFVGNTLSGISIGFGFISILVLI